MSIRRVSCLILLTEALTLRPQSPSPAIAIFNPANGAIVGSDKHLTLQARLDPAFIEASSAERISFTAVRTDQSTMFNLGQGNLRSLDGQDIAETIWDVSSAPSGDYFVAVQMRDHAGNHYQDTIQVTVDRAPNVSVDILGQIPVFAGVQVTFFPQAEDPDGDSFSQVTWTPGEGVRPLLSRIRRLTRTSSQARADMPCPTFSTLSFKTREERRPTRYAMWLCRIMKPARGRPTIAGALQCRLSRQPGIHRAHTVGPGRQTRCLAAACSREPREQGDVPGARHIRAHWGRRHPPQPECPRPTTSPET